MLRLGRLKKILIAAVLILGIIYIQEQYVVRKRDSFLSLSLDKVTARGGWFPNLTERVRIGSANTWRSSGDADVTEEVLDPIANRTFVLMKSGANVLWDRLPIHFETTFKRFPHHQIYADTEAVMGNETIIDVISTLPSSIINDEQVRGYRLRQQQLEESWGWDMQDIRQESNDGWNIDKLKNVPMLLHAYRNAPKTTDWFVFLDDDSYMLSQSLGSFLRGLNPSDDHYIGSLAVLESAFGGEIKEKLEPNDKGEIFLKFAHGGSGIILSRGAVESLFWDPQREDDYVVDYSKIGLTVCCGDALLGYMLLNVADIVLNASIDPEELKDDPFQGERISNTGLNAKGGWCSRIASWHHLESWEIQSLYDWEISLQHRKKNLHRGVLFSDFYHDFVLPFLQPRKENWDNMAGSFEYHSTLAYYYPDPPPDAADKDKSFLPAENVESCLKTCELYAKCISWKYEVKGDEPACFIELDYVRAGVAKNAFMKGLEEDYSVTSGWMMDRIIKLRSQERCELHGEFDHPVDSNFEEDQEGWYFRKLSEEQGSRSGEPVLEAKS